MERIAWRAKIAPGRKEEYIKRHNEIWPEMVAVLKEAGIENYTIFNDGDEVFGYYECKYGRDYATKVQLESDVVKRWDKSMEGILIWNKNSKEAQPTLTAIFRLE